MNTTAAERTKGRRQGTNAPHAFTLVELVMSLVVLSVLAGAMGSALLLSIRGIDDGRGGPARTASAAEAADLVLADLHGAIAFSERAADRVAFTVPDRDGDGLPESLIYEFDGERLLRSVNGSRPVPVAEGLSLFELGYAMRSSPPPVESGELCLMYHDDALLGSMREVYITSSRWCAQYFRPTLPSNAAEWRVSRVRIRARSEKTTDGVIRIAVTAADGDRRPRLPILAHTTIEESSLSSSYRWVDVPIGPATGLKPGQGVCIVIGHASGSGDVARIEYEDSGVGMTSDTHFMISTDGGGKWSKPNDKTDLRFFAYGTVLLESACN